MPNTTCSVLDCDRPQKCKSYCAAHYRRFWLHGDPLIGGNLRPRRGKAEPQPLCSIDGCDKPARGRGWCGTHYKRVLLTGEPGTSELRYKPFIEGMTEKQCTGCKEVKPLADFHRVNRASRYVSKCKPCVAVITARHQRRRLYGLDEKEYLAMREDQGDSCAVCGSAHRLCIDHDHATGAVRKLLCDMCNKAPGMAEDNPQRLRDLAAYLEAH